MLMVHLLVCRSLARSVRGELMATRKTRRRGEKSIGIARHLSTSLCVCRTRVANETCDWRVSYFLFLHFYHTNDSHENFFFFFSNCRFVPSGDSNHLLISKSNAPRPSAFMAEEMMDGAAHAVVVNVTRRYLSISIAGSCCYIQ